MTTRKLKGFPLDIVGERWDAAHKYVADKPDLCVIEDVESGYPRVVTKETAQKLKDIFEATKPDLSKIDPKFSGKFVLFGTSATTKNNDFKDFWNGNL